MQIAILGSFEVRADDGSVTDVPGARLRGLLAALSLEPGRVLSKTSLVDWIWGENPPADAANALQRLVSRLRKALPEGAIEGRPGGYRLTMAPDAVDAVRFERLVGRARPAEGSEQVALLREALDLWPDDFAQGAALREVGLEGSDAFEAAATRLERLRLEAMEDLFDAEVGRGRGTGVIMELTDAAAAHPLRERLAAALMRALSAAGRDSEALLSYERTREALADALGADPSPELAALHVGLLRGESGRRDATERKTNVRAELTSFVGRDDDLGAVGGLITAHRLTTLIGPGGSGKTRLATETARAVVGDFTDGVWLVELAPIGVDGDVVQTALAGLGLRDTVLGAVQTADPVDGLIAAIGDREMLLILDNCEHLIESAAEFATRVLGECRRLRILATSREPLGITGEALWPVEPLAVPISADGPQAAVSSAVALLRDRAGAVRRDLGTDDATGAAMVRICQALDGMPLAIELAAARLRTMSPNQLADRLDDRFRLLTGGSRTALPRHRTLRAVVDWSWDLLTDPERLLLARLSVFSGGAGLEAVEQVCAGPSDATDVKQDEVLELLTSLAEKSLLITEADGSPRYRMLGTIKEYAADRLAEFGETDPLRRAHLEHFTELSESAEPHLRRSEQLVWLARLETEHDNIAAATRRAIANGDAAAAMRLAAAAGWYWWLSGRRAEGIELLLAATELPGDVADEIRALAYGLVVLYVTSGQGDEHVGADWIHRAYRFSRLAPTHNPVLELVGPLERLLQSPQDAVTAFESLLDSEDPWVRAMARWQATKMATVLGRPGDDPEGQLARALTEFRTLGERFGMSLVLSELANQLAVRGEFAAACERYDQGVEVLTEIGSTEDIIEVRTRQAVLYWLAGDRDSSATSIAEAERKAAGVTWPYALVDLALAKAELGRLRGDIVEARQQVGRATALLGDVAEHAHVRARIHGLLGYLTDDLRESRTHRVAAWQAASEAGAAPVIAQMLVGVADLAVRLGSYEQAARLLAAADGVRGMTDRSQPDAVRIEQDADRHLGEARFAEVTQQGRAADWSELVETTLAS